MTATNGVNITVGGAEYIAPMAKLLAPAFADDPIGRYIYLCEDDLPNDAVVSDARREEGFVSRLTLRITTGPHLVEAGNWAAGAVWFPPGAKLNPPNPATAHEVLLHIHEVFSATKKRHLGDRQYWYLNLLGRNPGRTERGVVTALLTTYIEKAREAGVPAWVEASGTRSRDIYAYVGFRLVEEIKIGVGKADKNGFREAGGEGITLYAMIFEP